jgi:c-di-GMP-binding flagellar brake protein YcgR
MPFERKRKYKRKPIVKVIRYYLLAKHMEKLKKIDCEGVTIDISKGGLGMITDHPLRRGNTLFFEPEIKVNDSTAKASTVVWAKRIEDYAYRVGLEFHVVRYSKPILDLLEKKGFIDKRELDEKIKWMIKRKIKNLYSSVIKDYEN